MADREIPPSSGPSVPSALNVSSSALSVAAFRRYWGAQLVSMVGSWMHSAAQGWLIVELTASPAMIGSLACAGALPILVLSVIGGRLAGRLDRRRLLIGTQAALALQAAVFGTLLWTERLELRGMVALVVAFGTLTAFDLPAQRTFWADLVPRPALKSAVSVNATAFHGARMLGPLLAGAAMQAGLITAVFFVNAASYLLTLFVLSTLDSSPPAPARPAPAPPPARDPPAPPQPSVKGPPALLPHDDRSRGVRLLLGFVAVNSLGVFPYLIAFVPALVRTRLGAGELGLGLLMATSGAGALCGSLAIGKLPDERATRIVAGGTLCAAAALWLLAGTTSLALALPLTVLLALSLAASMAMALARLQLIVAPDQRGNLMGLYTLGSSAVAPIAAALWGLAGEYTGLPSMLRTMAGSASIATATLLVWQATRHPVPRAPGIHPTR